MRNITGLLGKHSSAEVKELLPHQKVVVLIACVRQEWTLPVELLCARASKLSLVGSALVAMSLLPR